MVLFKRSNYKCLLLLVSFVFSLGLATEESSILLDSNATGTCVKLVADIIEKSGKEIKEAKKFEIFKKELTASKGVILSCTSREVWNPFIQETKNMKLKSCFTLSHKFFALVA